MKYTLVLFMAIFLINANAQNKKAYLRDSSTINNHKIKNVELSSQSLNEQEHFNLPFANFIFKDVRFDTAYFAVTVIKPVLRDPSGFQKINTSKGLAFSMFQYFNENKNITFSQGGSSLVGYIKQLRITQKDSLNKKTNAHSYYNQMKLEIEGYLNKDDLNYPAVRIDTTIVVVSEKNKTTNVLENMLIALAKKVEVADTLKILRRNAYSTAELNSRYNKRFDKPILSGQKLNKGVYKTGKEFLSNAPSIKDYELKNDKWVSILYSKSATGSLEPEREVFGFCDGNIIWINVNNVFHPLIRQGNTFEFIADLGHFERQTRGTFYMPRDINMGSVATSALIYAATTGQDNYDFGRSVFQLNMETGDFD